MGGKVYINGEYYSRNPDYHVSDSSWKAKQILSIIKKNKLQIDTICDIGCGAGETLLQLQLLLSEHIDFSGYDISPDAIALAQKRASERLHFWCKDFLEISTEKFDLLLCIDVFEHVEAHLDFLRKLRDRATYKIFHLPLEMNALHIIRNRPILSRHKLGHLHYFMKDTAIATIKDAGYEIIDYFYTPSSLEMGKGGLGQKIINWPRRWFFKISPDFTVRLLGGYALLVLAH